MPLLKEWKKPNKAFWDQSWTSYLKLVVQWRQSYSRKLIRYKALLTMYLSISVNAACVCVLRIFYVPSANMTMITHFAWLAIMVTSTEKSVLLFYISMSVNFYRDRFYFPRLERRYLLTNRLFSQLNTCLFLFCRIAGIAIAHSNYYASVRRYTVDHKNVPSYCRL